MATPPASASGDDALRSRLLLLAPAWLILAVAALTPTAALLPDQGDVTLYFEKAQALSVGQVPYRDFSFFYPPAALLPMVVPFLARFLGPIDLTDYKVLFGGVEAMLALVLGLLLVRIAERFALEDPHASGAGDGEATAGRIRSVGWRLALLSVGAALALTWRYDLFPSVLVIAAVWAAIERRPALAGAALAVGVLAKLYPIAVLPSLAVPWLLPFDIRRLTRLGGAFALTIVVGFVPFLALAGSAAFGFFDYQVGHGIQVESVGGGIAVLGGLITGEPAGMSFANARVQVEGPIATLWLAIVPAITIAGFGTLGWLGWRRLRAEATAGAGGVRSATVVALAGASVLMLLVTSKVYSIQYVVWLLPFLALLRGRQFWLGASIVALTMPIHPLLYGGLVKQEAIPILVLNLRNGLVVALTALLLRDLAGRGSAAEEMARPAGLEPTTFRSAT